MRSTQIPFLYISESPLGGRGVFTSKAIHINDLIEICPVIILSNEDTRKIHDTHLHDYYFVWSLEEKTSAIALGYGSIYNHSANPNAAFNIEAESETIKINASKDIEAGGEVTLDYIGLKDADIKLWFVPR